MSNFLFGFGEALTILALVGLIAVLIWLVTTALRLKTAAITNAGRLYKRPLAAGKNLVTTAKGIALQEAVRGKHIGGSAKIAAAAVMEATAQIKETAQTVHPEEIKPALAYFSSYTKLFRAATKLGTLASRQKAH